MRARLSQSFVRSLLLVTLVLGSAQSLFAGMSPCGTPTAYTLNPTVTGTHDWTDTTGSVWQPGGGYPGCSPGDTAAVDQVVALTVTTTIPNDLAALTVSANGASIDIQSSGRLGVSGTGSIGSGATLSTNGGQFVVASGGTVTLDAGSAVQLNSGTLNVNSGGTLVFNSANVGGSAGTLENAGLVRQNSGPSSVSIPVNNLAGATGVAVDGGYLSLSGGGQGDAPFTISADATLDFPSGTYTMGSGGVVSGAGTLSVSGGTLSIGGVTSPANFALSGGTLTGAGFLSVAGVFDWSGGTLTGSGGSEIAGTGTGSLSGAAPMYLDGRTLNVYGSASYSATTNSLELSNGAVLGIYGTFNITDDGSIACNCSTPPSILVSPNGVLMKSGGAGTSVLSPPTTNNSQIVVFSGTLELAGDGTHGGSFYVASGTTLAFSAASSTLTNTSSISGGGVVDFPSGFTDIDGSYHVGDTWVDGGDVSFYSAGQTVDFRLTDGSLYTTSVFKMTGSGTWSQGALMGDGDGQFHVASGATLTIDAATCVPALVGLELLNDGTINYTPTAVSTHHLELVSGTITNNGTFDLQADAPITEFSSIIIIGDAAGGCGGSRVSSAARRRVRSNEIFFSPSQINNNGTWKKTGAGTTNIEPAFTNSGTLLAQSGVMNFTSFLQNAGTTSLAGGDLASDNTMPFTGGTLDGAGTITADVEIGTNSVVTARPRTVRSNVASSGATVAPGSGATTGVITIDGTYTQYSDGTMAIDIAGPSAGQFDQVAVTGIAGLDGTFTASLGYSPSTGTTWPVLTYASESGVFATQNLPPQVTSSYTPTAFVLTALAPTSDLGMSMTGPLSVNAGGSMTYTITITNLGSTTTSGLLVVNDTFPAGATGGSFAGGGWGCGSAFGGTQPCAITAAVAPGQSYPPLTYTFTAPATAGVVTNSATLTWGPDGDPTNNSASFNTTIVAQTNLHITKTGPANVTAGQNVTYTIVVTNNGPSTATGVSVDDPVPANLTFVSNTGACTGPFPCNIGTLTVGQSATITSTWSTSPSFNGNVTNIASASSATADPDTSDNTASATTLVGQQADLAIIKTGPTSVIPGQQYNYTISYQNNGTLTATSVVITDPTPPGVAFNGNTGGCVSGFPCSLGTLTPGQSGTFTSTYTVPSNYSAVTIVNTASISSAVTDSTTGNNSSTVTTNVAQSADLAITKTGPPTITPGQNIVYTVTVNNAGPSSAGSVVVSDTPSAGLNFVSNSGACTTTYPCSLGTMTNGQSAVITSTYNVPSNFGGTSVTNTASVASGATDSNNTNNSSTVTTAVLAQSDVSIVKTGPATATPGQNMVYTISVTNNGPLPATNTFVTDAPGGMTFVSNSGACTGPFPCSLGTIAVGQTATITSTFNVPANYPNATVTNTASVSTSTFEGNLANNSSSTTANVVAPVGADLSIVKTAPAGAAPLSLVDFTIVVQNNGPSSASNVVVNDPSPAGADFVKNSGGCTTAFPCNLGTLTNGQTVTITSTYRVAAVAGSISNTATVSSSTTDPNPANNSSTAVVGTAPVFNCPNGAPSLSAPASGAVVNSPVTFRWSSVANAIGYTLTVTGGGTPIVITTGDTNVTVPLGPGGYSWSVAASGVESCRPNSSASSSFVVCPGVIAAPLASVVGESTTGQTYTVEWTAVTGGVTYELQEATNPAFTNPTISTLSTTAKSFTKSATSPTTFYYRVRGVAACNPAPGPFSPSIAVVVVPVPLPTNYDPLVTVPNGSHTPVTWQIFIPGPSDGTTSSFLATVDRSWLEVTPRSGVIGPNGINLTISADPSSLVNGTWTGTIIVVFGTNSVTGRVASAGTTTTSIPISISLVTPVTPTPLAAASNSALVIPSVGHLTGFASIWRSDVRLANLAAQSQKYQLTFNPGNDPAALMKQTTISVDSGATTALDDIVRSWYGVGSTGTSSNGLLTVQPLDSTGKALAGGLSNATAVSSRTFNSANSATTGTLGQFIPAVPFGKFIGKLGGGALSSVLSLQQIAQSSSYRTNVGIVEAAGKSVSLLVAAFDGSGAKLFEVPVSLLAGEQKQLNGFLTANGVTNLENGRIEVRVTGGDGKVTAYASVVDNASSDPILISGTALGAVSNRFVVPGIADFSGGGANWRSDMRVFNSGAAPQTATLTFYPIGNGAPLSAQVNVAPGEVKQLDDVLHTTLGATNLGGALHVTTAVDAPLVVTARTYDRTSNGTLGQFIPAVTTAEAVGSADRPLQILQAEESPRYRTNIGVVEVTGKPATVEISVKLPDSNVTPVIQLPLAAFESRQIAVLDTLGLGNVYNVRVSVKVTDGTGRVTAYGSVVDNATKDPTFIPAQ